LRPIYAVRTDAAGNITDNKTAIQWSQDRSGNYMQTPLLHDGLAYFCYDNGVLTVYRLSNGERVYQQRLGGGKSGFTSSPVAAGGRLYITDEEGQTHVLAAGPEYKPLAVNELGEQVMATPALSGDVLYMRGRSHLFAIGAKK
jgi:outer membrane protein assembly factor BamB